MYTMHYPFGLWLPVLVLALTALLLAGTAALAFMAFAVTGEALTTRERLVARMGRPLVLLGVLDACLMLAGCGLLLSAFWTPEGFFAPWRGPFVGLAFMLLHGAIMGGVVLLIWQRMASAARRRVLLFCLGAIWLVAVLCGTLLAFFPLAQVAALPAVTGAAGDVEAVSRLVTYLLLRADPFGLGGAVLVLAGLGLAGGGLLGLLWLLVRRGVDDFGRDYYVHTVRFCASKAAWGCWLLFAGYVLALPTLLSVLAADPVLPTSLERLLDPGHGWGSWLVFKLGVNPLAWIGHVRELYPLLPLVLLLFVLPVLAALFFGRVSHALIPLRHKPSIVLGLLLMVATVWGQTFLLCLLV